AVRANPVFLCREDGHESRALRFSRGTTMSEPAIPSRFRLRVKQRLTVLTYAEEHGVKPASRHFGLNYKTVRRWRIRHQTHGVLGLVPRYPKRRRRRVAPEVIPLVKEARLEPPVCAAPPRLLVQRRAGG